MAEGAITWPQLALFGGALATVIAGLWALWGAIRGEMQSTRKASEEGRARLYDKMDQFAVETRASFTPRELHAAEVRALQHSDTELTHQLNALSQRCERQCLAKE